MNREQLMLLRQIWKSGSLRLPQEMHDYLLKHWH